MSFQFNWPEFDKEFVEETKRSLTTVLNQGPKPLTIADRIEVTDLSFGHQAPDIEVLSIVDLSENTFRATFKICYDGDAYLKFRTKVQANPISLTERKHSSRIMKRMGFLAAHEPLVVPMDVTIQDIKFAGILNVHIRGGDSPILDVHFKNDPLQSVRISSTFDDFASARQLVQGMVEGQLRNFLTVELPLMAKEMEPQLRRLSAKQAGAEPELRKQLSMKEGELLARRRAAQLEDELAVAEPS